MRRFPSLAFFDSPMATMALGFLLVLSGCARIQVRLGWKVYLDKTPIASIAASLPKGPGIAPGEKSPLVVAVTEPDGKVLQTEGQGEGKVLWKDLRITPSIVAVSRKGMVSLPRDPRISDGRVGHVTITVPSHPDLRAELDIPIRYNYKFAANWQQRLERHEWQRWIGRNQREHGLARSEQSLPGWKRF